MLAKRKISNQYAEISKNRVTFCPATTHILNVRAYYKKHSSELDINFTRLITNGEFGFLKIGQNKSEIKNQNLVPECWLNNESKESSRIWRYGNFELHFDDKTHLIGIFNDYVDELDGGESLNVMDN
ncbi:hypothetical protein [uncultured Aquimarina sp.]|uniref:hypothetical protein n=1 Tax=uncultured Aquimarina sp. TaxID=575652 RepID=UPI00261F144F|nr:hypothetical protein [uncultured Aquimarina sp.]